MIANVIKQFFGQDESGQGLVEYGLLVSLIAIAAIGAMTALNGGISQIFNKAATELTK